MRRIILVLIVAIVALIGAIQLGLLSFKQDRPAQVPGVEVTSNGITATGGQTPSFEVETGTVAVGTRSATVAVPVPTIEVRNPNANQVGPGPGSRSGATLSGFPLPAPMRRALVLGAEAAEAGEVPVGAVITRDGAIIAEARNAMRGSNDPTAHAEMVAIRAAAIALGQPRLDGCILWVTLEPCAMCAAAIGLARLAGLNFAATDPKGGGVEHGARIFSQPTCHHRPTIQSGVGEAEAAAQLKAFFAARRG